MARMQGAPPGADVKSLITVGIDAWESYEKLSAEPEGQGAFGKVYKAQHRETGDIVAIKVLKSTRLGGLNRTQAEREIALHHHSDHPRLIQLINVYESPRGELQLVMELAEGGDLFDYIMSGAPYREVGPYPPKEACKLMVLMVEALIQLHAQGVAHRDLKLENLLLLSRDRPCDFRLCDLGGAKWFPEGAAPDTHTQIGTKGYCAPEAYRSHKRDAITYDAFKVDVYSLGVVLYITLCGYPPWDLERMDPKKRPHPPKFRTQSKGSLPWAQVPEEAIDLIAQMLQPDPAQRIELESILNHPWVDPADLQEWVPVSSGEPVRAASGTTDAPPSEDELEWKCPWELREGERVVELWENQRFRLSEVRWTEPYTRASWTDKGGQLIFSFEALEEPPLTFQLPVGAMEPGAYEVAPRERAASCGALCTGVQAEGDSVIRHTEMSVAGEWEYATGWRRHTWYPAPSWRSFVRRRCWHVVVSRDATPVAVMPSFLTQQVAGLTLGSTMQLAAPPPPPGGNPSNMQGC